MSALSRTCIPGRKLIRRALRGGSVTAPPDDTGIPFVLVIYADPLNPDWEAVKVTLLDTDGTTPIDGWAAIGDQYVSGFLGGLGSQNGLSAPIGSTYTDAQRTLTIPRYLLAMPGGPHIHCVNSNHEECLYEIEEAVLPVEYGVPQAIVLDGSNTYVYDLTNLSLDFTELGGFGFLLNCRWTNLNANEVLCAFYNSADATNWIELRKSANNSIALRMFINSTLVGAGALPGHDFDVAVNGGINTDGWIAINLLNGASGLAMSIRSFFNANNTAFVTQNVAAATLAGFDTLINRVIFGARPDGTTEPCTGRVTSAVFQGGYDAAAQTITDTIWDNVREQGNDPYTQFERAKIFFGLVGRTPWIYRNRANGQNYISSSGTPAVTTTSVVDIPVDASWCCIWQQVTIPANGGDPVDLYIPESDGLNVLKTAPAHVTETITASYDADSDAAQSGTGPKLLLAGSGTTIRFTSNGAGAFSAWIGTYYGDKGP